MDETLDTFLNLCQQLSEPPYAAQDMVLATLVAGGSAAAGGRAWLDTDGRIYGAVTLGGCVDYQLRALAAQVRTTGQSALLDTLLGSGEAYEFGMTCSARVTVHLQRHSPAHPLWQVLAQRREAGEAVTLQTALGGQTQPWATQRQESARFVKGRTFYEVIAPPLRLYIVGNGPIIRPLSDLARTVGLRVSVVEELPPLGSNSLVVLASHQYDQEVSALRAALHSSARYIGLVASARRGAAVLDFLAQTGTPAPLLTRVRTPAGLSLGQPSPAGIALSIVAQLVQEVWGGTGKPLADEP